MKRGLLSAPQIAGDRPPFYQETMDQVNERQRSLDGVGGLAVRHIHSWGGMMEDLKSQVDGTNTIRDIADWINNNWPSTSSVMNPGIPNHGLNNETLANYAESWLDARHNDPANLFWGNQRENAALGEDYDNPTKAKGPAGKQAGSAFSMDEKKALIRAQIENLGGGTGRKFKRSIALTAWLEIRTQLSHPYDRQLDTHLNKKNDMDGLVKFLANQRVFTQLELHTLFRGKDNKTGPVR